MSRWTDLFKTHAFRVQWDRWKAAVDSIAADDPALIPHASELARLRKATRYVDGALSGLDPELIPLNFWDQLRDQISAGADQIQSFNGSKNIGHIHSAQGNLDVILSFVRPYMLTKGPLGATLQGAAQAYVETLDSSAKKLEQSIAATVTEIHKQRDVVNEYASKVERQVSEIQSNHERLLVGSEDQEAVINQIEEIYADFTDYSNELSVGAESKPSIKQSIGLAKDQAIKDGESISSLLVQIQQSVRELQAFHASVFGKPDEGGVTVGGTENEIKDRLEKLVSTEVDQLRRYEALNKKIESLLPGATSAGLASAYKEMRESFANPVRNANRMFYWSIASLVLVSIVLSIESISLTHIDFVKLGDWESVLRSLIYKLPFYAPVLWLAYYASKRRSEFQRLEQEYAHKEALAKSYDSYRQQILQLGSEDQSLMKELITKAVDAIAHNASTSLDGKHGDKSPYQEVIEKTVSMAADRFGK